MSYSEKKAAPFLVKTYQMLQNDTFSNILHWTEDGTGFVIVDTQQFSNSVLPKYFKHKNMHSYIRQLNMYGFSKKRGKTNNYYYHQHFLRGSDHLISSIQRRVENKISKQDKISAEFIDSQTIMQPNQSLININQKLLLQQVTNLQIIQNEMINENSKKFLSEVISKYVSIQNTLLIKLAGAKKQQILKFYEEICENKINFNDIH